MPSNLKHPPPCTYVERCESSISTNHIVLVSHCNRWFLSLPQPSNGILHALCALHSKGSSRVVLGLTSLLVVINCLKVLPYLLYACLQQFGSRIHQQEQQALPSFVSVRVTSLLWSNSFLIAETFPFLSHLAGLIGGIALPVTWAHTCFMWIVLKIPERYNALKYINGWLGNLGMGPTVIFVTGGLWPTVNTGLTLHCFEPE